MNKYIESLVAAILTCVVVWILLVFVAMILSFVVNI